MSVINIQQMVSDFGAKVQSARPNLLGRIQSLRGNSGGLFANATGRIQSIIGQRPKIFQMAQSATGAMAPSVGLLSTRFDSSAPDGGFRATPASTSPTDGGSGYRSTT